MARPKKDGRRATGIQGKNGYLYIVTSKLVMTDGVKKSKKTWIGTGLKDKPENVEKAKTMRYRILGLRVTTDVDRNVTISDYIDYVLDKKKREVSDTTYASYYYKSNRIKDHFGEIKVKDISEIMVEDFLDDLFEVHHLQKRSVKDIKMIFGSIMDLAVKEGLIYYNPVKEVKINKNLAVKYTKVKNKEEEFLSNEEAQYFLDRIIDHQLYELYYLTIYFGLRREEILGLRWSAIDFEKKEMLINHTVTKGLTVNRLNTTKTAASERFYPLTDGQIEMLNNLRAKEEANRLLFGDDYFESDYIFKHMDGTLYYPDYPSKMFKKLLKKMPELPQNVTFHGLRKSCVSMLVHRTDDKNAQNWIGHADASTTMQIYARVKDKDAKYEISSIMNELIRLNKNYEN